MTAQQGQEGDRKSPVQRGEQRWKDLGDEVPWAEARETPEKVKDKITKTWSQDRGGRKEKDSLAFRQELGKSGS